MQSRVFYDSISSLCSDFQVATSSNVKHQPSKRMFTLINGFITQHIVLDDPKLKQIRFTPLVSLIDTYLSKSFIFQFGKYAPNKPQFTEQDIRLHSRFKQEYEQRKLEIGDDIGYLAFNPQKTIIPCQFYL